MPNLFNKMLRGRNNDKKIDTKKITAFVLSFFVFISVVFFGFLFLYPKIDKWKIISAIPSPIRNIGRKIVREIQDLPYFFYNFKKVDLPIYAINIDQKDLDFLNENLPEPTFDAVLSAEFKETRPIKLSYGGEDYKATMRYRGDGKSHWLWPKKSLRIEINGDQLPDGERVLNFIVPDDRKYLIEELNNFRAKLLGLVVPKSRFVAVTINGKAPMMYWEVEQINQEFLEKANFSSDTNLYGDSDGGGFLYEDVYRWRKSNATARFSGDNYIEIDKILDIINNSSDEEFKNNIFSILDADNFYAWSIQTLLAKSDHQNWTGNMRFYFDSSRGKFIMIPWDVGLENGIIETGNEYIFNQTSNPLANRILGIDEFMTERNRRLWHYINTNERAEFDFYDNLYNQIRAGFYKDKLNRFSNSQFDDFVSGARVTVKNNFDYLRRILSVPEIQIFTRVNSDRSLSLDIHSRSLSPLSIENVRLSSENGEKVDFFIKNHGNIIDGLILIPPNIERRIWAENNDFENSISPEWKYLYVYELKPTILNLSLYFTAGGVSPKNIEIILKNSFTSEQFTRLISI